MTMKINYKRKSSAMTTYTKLKMKHLILLKMITTTSTKMIKMIRVQASMMNKINIIMRNTQMTLIIAIMDMIMTTQLIMVMMTSRKTLTKNFITSNKMLTSIATASCHSRKMKDRFILNSKKRKYRLKRTKLWLHLQKGVEKLLHLR